MARGRFPQGPTASRPVGKLHTFGRVRKAFMEQITYDVARNYFIEGKQGMPKRISLDRSLVEWEISI